MIRNGYVVRTVCDECEDEHLVFVEGNHLTRDGYIDLPEGWSEISLDSQWQRRTMHFCAKPECQESKEEYISNDCE